MVMYFNDFEITFKQRIKIIHCTCSSTSGVPCCHKHFFINHQWLNTCTYSEQRDHTRYKVSGCLQEVKKIKIFEMSSQVLVTFAFERWLLTRALTGKILVFWIGGSK